MGHMLPSFLLFEPVMSVFAFLLGLVIGSFLNVVVYRMHTGKTLGGHSRCLSCGLDLRWYELVPVISYIVLRARCRRCDSWIPLRYALVEVATGGAFLLVWVCYAPEIPVVLLMWALAATLIVIFVYDLRHMIIPDELVSIVAVLAGGLVVYEVWWLGTRSVVFDVLAGVLVGGFFWLLWYVSQGRWIGLGDAKLAFPLAVIAGVGGAFGMLVFSFWSGAVVGLLLLGFARLAHSGKKYLSFFPPHLTIKSEVPFAPFLIFGFILAHVFHVQAFFFTEWFLG